MAVSTRHSSFGVAKLIRADFVGLPDLAMASASAIAIPGERTSRVTVFIEMPPDVAFELCEQLVQSRELTPCFRATRLTVNNGKGSTHCPLP